MNTKRMVTNAILIAIGAILHQITPPIVGIQADLSLAMLFMIVVFNKDYKTTLICGIIIGIFAALTTKTPGGLVPNIIDKFVTCNVAFLILMPLRNKISKLRQISILLPLGTLVSGATFIAALATIAGLPAGFSVGTIFVFTVIPTAAVNTVLGIIIFKIVEKIAVSNGSYAIQ
ncbi:tryptophan transporter [Clostridium sp. BL-8]|uniref:tryptophan transporter n=1 Tax=Clostridium sp. BL-8 TaxID=349938 RepID=UPI00098CDEEF|nr:tryptophan transporter [Clostridium sp. BL-8]OOM73489.1 putative tryptophan transport protein [Clostridium sp. BL-8]